MSFVSLSGYATRVGRAALRFDRSTSKAGMVCRFSIKPSRRVSAPVALGMTADQ